MTCSGTTTNVRYSRNSSRATGLRILAAKAPLAQAERTRLQTRASASSSSGSGPVVSRGPSSSRSANTAAATRSAGTIVGGQASRPRPVVRRQIAVNAAMTSSFIGFVLFRMLRKGMRAPEGVGAPAGAMILAPQSCRVKELG